MEKYSKCPVCYKKGLYSYVGPIFYKGFTCRYCKTSWATHSRREGAWFPLSGIPKRIATYRNSYLQKQQALAKATS